MTLRSVWEAVHQRLSSGRPVSSVRVGPLSESARESLADLLGLASLPGEYAMVSLSKLDEAVGDVRAVVISEIGPLDDVAARRAAEASAREELWTWLDAHEVVTAEPSLREWVAHVRRLGVSGSVDATRALLTRVLQVLERLPSDGRPLPAFADQVLGETHALDADTRESALVLRALATLCDAEPPSNAGERRALWERAGTAEDELSVVVTAAGLRTPGYGIASIILRECRSAGHAAVLTLAQLRASRLINGPHDVWIVENPSVFAQAVQRFGTDCPPIVCVSGWPNSAAMLLLQQLADAGSALHYHGDFDGEGIRIAAHVMARTGVRPWLMSADDYLAALELDSSGGSVGRVTEAPWDPRLAPLLREHRVAVAEEWVSDLLLDWVAELGKHR